MPTTMENHLFDYWPMIRRPRLDLPGGARLAFWIGYNIEHFELDKPSTSIFDGTAMLQPDPLNFGWRDYGVRVGVWRMMELLKKYDMRASVMLNADVCAHYPEIVEEGTKLGWAWLAHGKNNSIFQAGMSAEDERAYLADIVTTIGQSTGKQPKGWLGPGLTETFNTPNLLAELGIEYVLDWCNDDQPYPMKVSQGRMIGVPYSIEVNDIPMFLGKGFTGEQFYQAVIDQFDQLYAEGEHTGRVMCLALHPFIINQPFRHKYLDRALDYITGHAGVWFATSDEIAEWYYREHYDAAVESMR
ncbi:polysaccharide deacetylase family protein [Actinocrispum wychmicini]|uniref:Polysaccharide deacetylase n=1 Tax=Actinocrispum wychmicini TaxID=1213861 RepID=A0A4R2JD53_9PSEU|nr:polysaccharide deacetylase family protein [Actinocrispum wychmicini]TCO54718.1 polysaccharide deacetylase [Actinocrispum wychmicini]